MGELAHVIEIDGRRIGAGSAGSVTKKLKALFAERTRTEGEELLF
jgi:hypothetical protein